MNEQTYITFCKEIYNRLPYKLFVYYDKCEEPIMLVRCVSQTTGRLCLMSKSYYLTEIEPNDVKLILRPLTSMTTEERDECDLVGPGVVVLDGIIVPNANKIDWLIQRHFDFRDWISYHMAIPVTDDFNPYQNPFEYN